MRILDSARKHGIADADMLHAVTNALWVVQDADGEVVIFVGPASDGTVLEVGVVPDEADPRIIHAMHVRAKFLPQPPKQNRKR